jgi:hypothetical protein
MLVVAFFRGGISVPSAGSLENGDERTRNPESAKGFGGLEVIANLNLTIPDGQRHAVIGQMVLARPRSSI